MVLPAWFRRLVAAAPQHHAARPTRPRRRPALEALEDRLAPATLLVNSNLDSTTADSVLTLREAVAVLNAQSTAGRSAQEIAQITGTLGTNDTIQFAPALAGQTITLSSPRLTVSRNVSINGLGAKSLTVSGNLATQIFFIDGQSNGRITVSIQDVTLTSGSAGGGGPQLDGLDSAVFGGAVVNNRADLTLQRVVISGSTAQNNGGAVMNWQGGSTLTLISSTLSENSTFQAGGGVANATGSTVTLDRATLSGNISNTEGGGLFNAAGGTLVVNSSTVTGNQATTSGGGLAALGTETLRNTLVAGNLRGSSTTSADDIGAGTVETASNNLISDAGTAGGVTHGTSANIVGNAGAGTLSLGSLLGALADNGGPTRTHALVQNSPAIGAGSAALPGYSPYDQRGAFRDPSAPDIGAYEVQHPLAPVGVPTAYATTFQPRPSASANEAFVKGLYQSTLLRAADSAGMQGWLAALGRGVSRTDVAYGFVNSFENRASQVTFYYRYFLGRAPESLGLNGWVGVLQAGVDEGTVMSGFLLSTEFAGQNTNASFVNLMYYAVLGRQAEASGFTGWKAVLDNGTATREQVGNGFLRSQESLARVVTADYGSYLKRVPTPAEVAPWVTAVGLGLTFGRAAAGLLGSGEFFAAAGQNMS